jgi:hypothetical protein
LLLERLQLLFERSERFIGTRAPAGHQGSRQYDMGQSEFHVSS